MDILLFQMQREFMVAGYLLAAAASGDRTAAQRFLQSKARFDDLRVKWEAASAPVEGIA